ncbi:cytochrome P450 CYP12A2-like [Cydia splendana]|uniref:cytochrome P450 CYP12A2-like n=1 Tax=Cydia splendana TaxID=1100963 RepID=UPI00213EFC45
MKKLRTLLYLQNQSRYQNIRTFSVASDIIKPFEEIPGISKVPIIGGLHHFLPFVGTIGHKKNFHDLVKTLHKKYGTVVRLEGIAPRATLLVLFEPQHFEQVYKAEEYNPLRPGFETIEYYREVLRKERFGGYFGLMSAQGPQWRDFRTKVNPALLKPKLVKIYAPGLGEIAEEMVERLTRLSKEGDYLQNNFDLEITKWSLESLALVSLGTRLGCLQDNLDEDHPARQLIKCTNDIFELSFKLEFLPSLWKYIATPNFKKLMKTYDLQWDISAMYIEEAKKLAKERGSDVPEEDKSILEKLIAIDERVAILMANEMLMAGIDTVSFTITSILYHLAKNQPAQDKLREEIRAGESRRYLRACMKESLRIWAVVPSNLRRTSKEHVVAGYRIPVGIDVIAPNEYLSSLDKYYPRGKEFLPERWLVEKTDPLFYGNAHPLVNAPFGIGVRSCIGRRIAELEIEVFLTKLLVKQQVTWTGPPIKVVTKVMNSFAKPYYFKFESV